MGGREHNEELFETPVRLEGWAESGFSYGQVSILSNQVDATAAWSDQVRRLEAYTPGQKKMRLGFPFLLFLGSVLAVIIPPREKERARAW